MPEGTFSKEQELAVIDSLENIIELSSTIVSESSMVDELQKFQNIVIEYRSHLIDTMTIRNLQA